jgi:hypothetical protein
MSRENGHDTGPDAVRAVLESAEPVSVATPEPANALGGPPDNVVRHPRADDLPEPVDIFADALAGTPDLPPDLLPPAIDDFARDEASRMGVEPGPLAMAALAVCASAIDDAYRVQPKTYDDRWTESARLWVAIVGGSGDKKSPMLKATTTPLRQLEGEWIAAYLSKLPAHRLALSVFKKKAEAYAKSEAAGKESGPPPKEPDEPVQRRAVIEDATVPAIAEKLKGNPRGALGVYDELTRLVGSFGSFTDGGNSTPDRSNWLELYNGGRRIIDRKVSGTTVVPNWGLSLVGGITPGEFSRVLGKITEDGLVQRFMPIFCRTTGDEEDRAPNMMAVDGYRRVVSRLLAMSPIPGDAPFKLAAAAQKERQFLVRQARDLARHPITSSAFKAHLSKWEGLYPRLLLTFHLVEGAAEERDPERIIGEDTAERVARLMLNFLLPHAARFYSEVLDDTPYDAHARWVAGHILANREEIARRKGEISARDIGRVYGALRKDRQAIERVMDMLALVSWVIPSDADRGRPPQRWRVNHRVYTKFKARAEAEAQRRHANKDRVAAVSVNLGLDQPDSGPERSTSVAFYDRAKTSELGRIAQVALRDASKTSVAKTPSVSPSEHHTNVDGASACDTSASTTSAELAPHHTSACPEGKSVQNVTRARRCVIPPPPPPSYIHTEGGPPDSADILDANIDGSEVADELASPPDRENGHVSSSEIALESTQNYTTHASQVTPSKRLILRHLGWSSEAIDRMSLSDAVAILAEGQRP